MVQRKTSENAPVSCLLMAMVEELARHLSEDKAFVCTTG
jgi:hypothetical protein